MRNFISLVVVLGLMLLGVSALGASRLDMVKKRQALIAGVKFDAPPFGFVDRRGRNVGFEIDLARYLAKRLGVKLKLVQVTSKTRILLLINGHVDLLIATMTHKRERDRVIDFSITYFLDGQKLLVKKNSRIKTTRDLAGRVVATVQGSTSERNIAKAQPKVRILTFQEYPMAFLALRQGKADAVTTDSTILLGLKKGDRNYEIVGDFFSSEPYGIGVPENDSKWRDYINFALMDWWDSGQYQRTYAKWFGPASDYRMDLTFEMEVWP
ncbi:MAG: ABC transporter substrate-binding protein [Thermodesulfobacteriota bacterium]